MNLREDVIWSLTLIDLILDVVILVLLVTRSQKLEIVDRRKV